MYTVCKYIHIGGKEYHSLDVEKVFLSLPLQCVHINIKGITRTYD